jgi:C-terminal processing protease CtpA/Prc
MYNIEKAEKGEYNNRRFFMSETLTYDGLARFDHNVYVLVGEGTASAADTFTAVAKQTDNAVIIGTNTAGEGLQATLFAEILPKSKLVYMYNPATNENSDGTSNGIYGTSPDIYVEVDREGYAERLKIEEAGEDYTTFENRMKWDNVLLFTIDMIKEKENE